MGRVNGRLVNRVFHLLLKTLPPGSFPLMSPFGSDHEGGQRNGEEELEAEDQNVAICNM